MLPMPESPRHPPAQRPVVDSPGPSRRRVPRQVVLPVSTRCSRLPVPRLALFALAVGLAFGPAAHAQPRPYIGFVYPAGGQQGATFQIRLGGQGLDGVDGALVTGAGVSARVIEHYRRLNNQEVQLLREQLRELRSAGPDRAGARGARPSADSEMQMASNGSNESAGASGKPEAASGLIARIETRTREFVQAPACAAIAAVTLVEITIAPDAAPGGREIRLVTPRGASNPLPFHVGQLPEFSGKPMPTTPLVVLGKEASSRRGRSGEEAEHRIDLPATVNGQIAAGQIDRYRFAARRGQRLVIAALGRQLVPFVADAVPGWFQPVLALYDAEGREVAYADDDRFKPDPVILYEVPRDGDYVVAIRDSLYRGREDFVYRISLGELPFLTSLFPLGGRVGDPQAIAIEGWNLDGAELTPLPHEAAAGVHWLAANRKGILSNRMPFALDPLPSCPERQPNDTPARPQPVTLPVMIDGRIEHRDDWDVFQFAGKANQTIVAEVYARRLDSPLDSILKLTDAQGNILGFNDDCEDLAAGMNTHHADSYLVATLPADGRYCIHIGDTARNGGDAFAYRLRLGRPRPDFELRVVPSSIGLRGNANATLTVFALRKDGFAGPIRVALKDPPPGFSAAPVVMSGTQTVARLNIRATREATREPVSLSVVGTVRLHDWQIARTALPAEDRMQAFLWRHLLPAEDLEVLVFNPADTPRPRRAALARPIPATPTNAVTAATNNLTRPALASTAQTGTNAAAPPKFTKQQIAGRLRQLRLLFDDDLLTDEFYAAKVAECEAAQ